MTLPKFNELKSQLLAVDLNSEPMKFRPSMNCHSVDTSVGVLNSVIYRHTKATKSHILSRGPPTGCHHYGQTLTIDHILLECALLQEGRDEYYTVDSLNALFKTIPETCIVEFLREAGFFYLIWCNLLTSTSPQTRTIWSDLSNCLENESNSWDTLTCVERLICPEGHVSSLNKPNPSIYRTFLCKVHVSVF